MTKALIELFGKDMVRTETEEINVNVIVKKVEIKSKVEVKTKEINVNVKPKMNVLLRSSHVESSLPTIKEQPPISEYGAQILKKYEEAMKAKAEEAVEETEQQTIIVPVMKEQEIEVVAEVTKPVNLVVQYANDVIADFNDKESIVENVKRVKPNIKHKTIMKVVAEVTKMQNETPFG